MIENFERFLKDLKEEFEKDGQIFGNSNTYHT